MKKLCLTLSSVYLSVWIGSSWNLQMRWTWIKFRIISNTGQIGSLILEFCPLDCWKQPWLTLSSVLLVQFWLDLPEIDEVDMDEISDDFETLADRIIDLRVISPRLLKKQIKTTVESLLFKDCSDDFIFASLLLQFSLDYFEVTVHYILTELLLFAGSSRTASFLTNFFYSFHLPQKNYWIVRSWGVSACVI